MNSYLLDKSEEITDLELISRTFFLDRIKREVNTLCNGYEAQFARGSFFSWPEQFKNTTRPWVMSIVNEVIFDNLQKPFTSKKMEETAKELFIANGEQTWAEIFGAYPIVEQAMDLITQDVIDHLAETANHISDFTDEPVTDVSSNNGDLHNKGRSVHIITLGSGKKIVYKPRSLRIDNAWNSIAGKLSELMNVSLFLPRVFDFEDHGFVEFIEEKHPETDEGKRRLFYKTGMILAAAYILGASDLHHENIIPHNDHPVIIDLETITHKINENEPYYVNSTLILPYLMPKSKAIKYNRGALTSDGYGFKKEVMCGFDSAYETIVKNKADFLECIKEFKGAKTRLIHNNTQYYASVIDLICVPSKIKNKPKSWIKLKLKSLGLDSEEDISAISRGNIPIFTEKIDSLEYLKERIDSLNKADKKRQLSIIENSLIDFKTNNGIDKKLHIAEEKADITEFVERRLRRYEMLTEKYFKNECLSLVPEHTSLRAFVSIGTSVFAEGLLSIAACLAAWDRCFMTDRWESQLKKISEIIHEKLVSVKLSYFEYNFADGLTGFCYMMGILRKLGQEWASPLFSESMKMLETPKHKIIQKSSDITKELLYSNASILLTGENSNENYGIIKNLIKDLLKDRKYSSLVNESGSVYFNHSLFKVFSDKTGIPMEQELPETDDFPCENDSLLFGNAGYLSYLLDENRFDDAEKLAQKLIAREKLSFDIGGEDFDMISFLCGEQGLIYTLIRILSEGAIPSVWEAL